MEVPSRRAPARPAASAHWPPHAGRPARQPPGDGSEAVASSGAASICAGLMDAVCWVGTVDGTVAATGWGAVVGPTSWAMRGALERTIAQVSNAEAPPTAHIRIAVDAKFRAPSTVALTTQEAMDYLKASGELGPNLNQRLAYIAPLFPNPLQILARGGATSITDLSGKRSTSITKAAQRRSLSPNCSRHWE